MSSGLKVVSFFLIALAVSGRPVSCYNAATRWQCWEGENKSSQSNYLGCRAVLVFS